MLFRAGPVALLALVLGGCACANPKNTPLLTALDGLVKPETTGEKVALAPVFVPVGAACGALDIAVVHPLHSVLLAGEDTWRAVWAQPQGSFVERSIAFVPKAAVTPVVFAFCWLGESLFNVRDPGGQVAQ